MSVTPDILVALDDTGVWPFLATRGPHACIVAPATVLRRVLDRAPDPRFACATEMPAPISGRNIFVWDLDPAVLRRARSAYPACRVFGILRDVWCATIAGSDVFAPVSPPPSDLVRYAIVCPPRSGSTFLCGLLREAGLGSPREHLRQLFLELCAAGHPFDRLMDWLIERGACGGYFGTKMISHYVEHASAEARAFLQRRGFQVIRLLRDPAEEAISGYFAHRTGTWHLQSAERAETAHAAVPYDADELCRIYLAMRRENRNVREFTSGFSSLLEISYSELDEDPAATVGRVAQFLRAPPGSTRTIDFARVPHKISRRQQRMQEYLSRLRRDLAERGLDGPEPEPI